MTLNKIVLDLAIAIAVATSTFAVPVSAFAQSKPNVIVIIADDAGYADFGFMDQITGGTSKVKTPNLDALAARGVTFSRAYVAANCQPTRAAIVTGGYQQRIGNENVGNNHYRADQVFEGVPQATDTLWDRMKGEGYSTGAVGKWHLGQMPDTTDAGGNVTLGNRPQNQGVDEFYGIWHGSREYDVGRFTNPNNAQQVAALREAIVHPNGTITDTIVEADHDGEYVTNTFGQYGVNFIANHHDDGKPFMLYQSFTAPHKPWNESPDFDQVEGLDATADTYRKQVASMTVTMDKEIGRMMDRLDDPNGDGDLSDSIRDNTLVVFVNDNGGVAGKNDALGYVNGTDNGPLSQFKGSPREGGIRVPMIIAGAGVSQAVQNTVYDAPVHGIDILPTAFGAAGGTFGPGETKIDGVDLLPFINGEDTADPHDVLVHRWRGTFAVIKGDWKLINTNNIGADPSNYRLYNVDSDIGETNNLISDSQHAEMIEEMKRDLTDHESFFDKSRYAILNRSVDDDPVSTKAPEPLNIFDHFKFSPTGTQTINWSDDDVWVEGGTSNVKNMYSSDAFAGAVVEFGTSDDGSYTANNDLLRQTGMDYMLNKMVLSGDFDGAQDQSATIQGNQLLFTNNLDGVGPQLAIDANNVGGNDYTYNINNDLVLYDDFTITGDGDVKVNIHGQIRDYFDARGLTKSGTSKVTLTGENTYGGDTVIEGGTLALGGAGSIANTKRIEIQAGATFDVSGTNSGGMSLGDGQLLQGSGTVVGDITATDGSEVAPGSSFGQLLIDGNLTLEAGAKLSIELGLGSLAGTDYDQLAVLGNFDINGADLEVTLDNWQSLEANRTFDILSIGEFGTFGSGNFFASINLPELSNGLAWDTSALLTTGQISTIVAVPEPGSLLFLGAISVVAINRRKRKLHWRPRVVAKPLSN